MGEADRSVWRRAVLALPALLLLVDGPASAGGGVDFHWGETYAGAFVGVGRTDSRIVDRDGFSNWGNPGHAVDYGDDAPVGGVLIGKKFALGGVPLRFEIDGAFGRLSAKTNRLDPPRPRVLPTCPRGGDETAKSEFRWTATARVGVEQAVGPATVFAGGGLAIARIVNSLTDLDHDFDVARQTCSSQRADPDDSFRDGATELGWVVGVGVETPLAGDWTLRLEASYLDFGRSAHAANLSGDDRCCGAGSPRRPVSYAVENKLGVLRLAVVRRFDW